MMKGILFCLLCLFSVLGAAAQSKYVSYSPRDAEDRIAELGGRGGVLILFKRNDLVIFVTNAKNAAITPKGKRSDGLYEYEVLVDRNEQPTPKIEVSRRGDINRINFVARVKPDFLRAYLIEEVEKPIAIEDQTSGNDAVLDASLAEVEISSTITDLKIDCDASLGATINRARKKSDNSIVVTTIQIPIANIQNGKKAIAEAEHNYDILNKKENKTDAEWEQLDKYEAAVTEAHSQFQKMCSIDIYAAETNHLPIDVSTLTPRSKMCYGVLLLRTVVKEYETQCAAMLAEGARLFNLREYDGAKRAFSNALADAQTPQELIPTIENNIAQCDTCMLYERMTVGAMVKLQEMRKNNTGTQTDVVRYASAAVEFLKVLENYNPREFYETRISKLEHFVEDMPLAFRFFTSRWISNRVSVYEDGMMPNVEIWAYYGDTDPAFDTYNTDRKQAKQIKKRVKTWDAMRAAYEKNFTDEGLPRDASVDLTSIKDLGLDKNAVAISQTTEEIKADLSSEAYSKTALEGLDI